MAKSSKLEVKIGFEEIFESLCVCVDGIISDYCDFQNDCKKLFFKFKMFFKYLSR